jgi:plasmid stabilization system protein ParE
MLPLRLHPAAVQELTEAWSWYETKREGLGDEFRACVDAGMAEIGRSPLEYARVRGEARRKVLRRFPYVLIYFVKTSHVEVIAVFHTSRDPAGWQERGR